MSIVGSNVRMIFMYLVRRNCGDSDALNLGGFVCLSVTGRCLRASASLPVFVVVLWWPNRTSIAASNVRVIFSRCVSSAEIWWRLDPMNLGGLACPSCHESETVF